MDLRDRKSAVFEIQEQLRILYKAGYELPLISPNGIFDQRTEDAVKSVQKRAGLPETGIVDVLTWKFLFSEAEKYYSP